MNHCYILKLRFYFLRIYISNAAYTQICRLNQKNISGDDRASSFPLHDAHYVLKKRLSYIINLAIDACIFLMRWKCASIRPVFKKDDQTSNYTLVCISLNIENK